MQMRALSTILALAVAACQQSEPDRSRPRESKSQFEVIETAWTLTAAEKAEKLVAAALEKDPNGGLKYALPELRIYNPQQELIYHVNGATPGKTAAILHQAISANRKTSGPSFQETLDDLETPNHRAASERVRPGNHITVFDYWAEWCVPCKALEKELLAWAADQPNGSVQIVRAEADPMKLARTRGNKVIMMKRDSSGKLIKVEMK